jgi:hypothetical protein
LASPHSLPGGLECIEYFSLLIMIQTDDLIYIARKPDDDEREMIRMID